MRHAASVSIIRGIEASRFIQLVHAAVNAEGSQAGAARRLGISTSYVSKILRNVQDPAVQENTLVAVGKRLGLKLADWSTPRDFDDAHWAQFVLNGDYHLVAVMLDSGRMVVAPTFPGDDDVRFVPHERPEIEYPHTTRSLVRLVQQLAGQRPASLEDARELARLYQADMASRLAHDILSGEYPDETVQDLGAALANVLMGRFRFRRETPVDDE